ncbi:MAG: cobaltochelatase subunit CobN [Nitrososphaerales archaeon]
MRKYPMKVNRLGLTNEETLNLLHKLAARILYKLLRAGIDSTKLNANLLLQFMESELGNPGDEMLKLELDREKKLVDTFKKALNLVERINQCTQEYEGFILGLEGKYIEPEGPGSITRGKFDILPTGRNFFAIDPTVLPTPAAWRIGVGTAEKLLQYYFKRHGRYPESVGQWLWSLDGYKADGEQLAQVLYLIGVKPIWNLDGSIKGIEVIPLEDLGRPRVDVTIRLSGIVRDSLPNYIYLIDDAVSKVVALDEPSELNYVRKHYLENLEKLRDLGVKGDEGAKSRVWCSPPGTYGAGINLAVEASAWKNDEDLAKTWIQWGCYMYTRKSFGKACPEAFILNVNKVDVVTRNHISDEHDVFNCCCYYSYQGGFYNTIKSLTNRNNVEIAVIDTKDVSSIEVRSMKDEIERIVRAKLLNPAWISAMKDHSYRGANEFSKKILHLYGWSASTKLVDKWVFDEIAKTYALDQEMRSWFEQNNVWALEEILRRLIEAAERKLWKADEELLKALREVYAEIEGILEEEVGEGYVQGSSMTWFSPDEVERWKEKLATVSKAWKQLVPRRAGKA